MKFCSGFAELQPNKKKLKALRSGGPEGDIDMTTRAKASGRHSLETKTA